MKNMVEGQGPKESDVNKPIGALYRGSSGLFMQHNAFMLQRIGDSADAPRALTNFRGLLVAAGVSVVFWTLIVEAFF